jgi:hypothetical protein
MLTEIEFNGIGKTYATRENARKAAWKVYGTSDLRFMIVQVESGRFTPVFLGEKAVSAGVHFNFPVAG